MTTIADFDPECDTAFLERKRAFETPVAGLFPPSKTSAQPISAASTLTKTKTPLPSLFHRPELAHPNYMREVLSVQPAVENTLRRQLDLFRGDSAQGTKSLEELQEAKETALRNYAEEIATKNSWSVLSKVSQYIASSSTIFMGVTIGGWAGVALIASGGLGLGNRAVHDTVGWQAVTGWFTKNQEIQKSLAQKIEMGSFYLSLGLGLAGGMWAYKTGALALRQGSSIYAVAASKIGKVIGTATTISGTAANFGESYASKKVENLRADLKVIEADITKKNQNMSDLCREVSDVLDTTETVTDAMGKLVTASDRSIDA